MRKAIEKAAAGIKDPKQYPWNLPVSTWVQWTSK
jgi:hypothetical protein